MKHNNLHATISDELAAQLADLARRLAPFGYSANEVIEQAVYHGSKTVECVAIGHESDAARVYGQRRAAG